MEEPVGPQALRFVRIVERARLKRITCVLSSRISEMQLKGVLATVTALGERGERVFGGFLTVYLPEDCTYDPVRALYGDLPRGTAGGAAPVKCRMIPAP